jgi:hypothetical protein
LEEESNGWVVLIQSPSRFHAASQPTAQPVRKSRNPQYNNEFTSLPPAQHA